MSCHPRPPRLLLSGAISFGSFIFGSGVLTALALLVAPLEASADIVCLKGVLGTKSTVSFSTVLSTTGSCPSGYTPILDTSSLVGPQGPMGPQGPEGPQGPQGPQGEVTSAQLEALQSQVTNIAGAVCTAEICDGRDNDCNGVVDDNLTPPVGICASQGECAGVSFPVTCQGARGFRCDYFVAPRTEIDANGDLVSTETRCDGLDGNCNGLIDDGCS